MANKNEWFRRFIMSFSFKERREKELTKYRRRIAELMNMPADELDFEYITLKSQYEHKKNILTILLISIALAIITNAWKYFFIFMEKALQYASSFKGNEIEMAKISFIISITTVTFVTLFILAILIANMKEVCRMQKELMIVETVRNEQPEK